IEPAFLDKTGSTTLVISVQLPAAEMIKVPGAITFSPFGYFCFIDNESLPVGMLIPNSIAKSEQAFTAWYKRASSPSLLQAHIQFADKETPAKPFLIGANTKLDKDSAIAVRLPAAGSTIAATGECPTVVAMPSLPLKSNAITPTLFNGNCNGPTHCCLATRPPTQRSTLLVNQSLAATASNCNTLFK